VLENNFRYAIFNNITSFNTWHDAIKLSLGVDSYANPILNQVDDRVAAKVRVENITGSLNYRTHCWAYINDFWPHDEPHEHWDKSKTYKIYKYVAFNDILDLMIPPVDVNYKTGLDRKLYVKHTFNMSPKGASWGELVKSVYYETAELDSMGNPTNYQNPILEVHFTWIRDGLGFCVKRISTMKWYLWDDTLDEINVKTMEKLYSKEMAISEGKRRRGNIVDALYMPVLGFLLYTQPLIPEDNGNEMLRQQRLILTGRTFLAQHKSAFTNFIDDSNKQVIIDVNGAEDAWLDTSITHLTGVPELTIRGYIASAFDISV
jgi:hypothetical protein